MLARKWVLQRGFYDTGAQKPDREVFEDVLTSRLAGGSLRVVKTLSTGQSSGPYLQDEDEWVLVLEGKASLRLDGPAGPVVTLGAGDSLYLPASLWHEVTETSNPCVWLCLYWDAASEACENEEATSEAAGVPEMEERPMDFRPPLALTAEQERAFREGVLGLRLVLRLPYVQSLKEKRSIRQRVIAALEQDRRLSVREVSHQDSHKALYLSVASVVMNEGEAQALAEDIQNAVVLKLADEGFIAGMEMAYL